MPPSIDPEYRLHNSETAKLLGLCNTLNQLPATHQKLVAEIVLLRLFSLFENLVSSISTKLACGARYADGSSPALLVTCDSVRNARYNFQNHARTSQRELKWSKASDIKENVRYVIDPADNFIRVVNGHGTLIDEIRRVRNRIAHNNARSRSNYRLVVRRHYGAYLNHVTPGMLLLTPRISPCLLDQYIRKERILVKDLIRA
jgi:hypothetical protein